MNRLRLTTDDQLRLDVRLLARVALATLVLVPTLFACSPSSDDTPSASERDRLLELGQRVYTTQCALCHGGDGRGMGQLNPSLVGSEILAGEPRELARLILVGSTALPATEQARYSNVMPPSPFLSDDEIAGVLTYVRDRYGAEGLEPPTIDPAVVQAERTGGR